MRALCALPAVLLLAACARKPEASAAVAGEYKLSEWLSLPKNDPKHVASRDSGQLWNETVALEKSIGAYPARFHDETERQAAYQKWSDLLLDARALDWPPGSDERRFWVFGELYRQGYDLGIRPAAEAADQNLSQCLAEFPASVACNFSLVNLYLSVKPTPERMERAEHSLAALRVILGPDPNEGVEVEIVYLKVAQRDAPAAQEAIDSYLEKFPNGQYAARLVRLRAKLDNGLKPTPALEP